MQSMHTTPPSSAAVSLREITAQTVRAITDLVVAPEQSQFVAPNAVSLAQALFAPDAWYRAIYRGDEPVGFVMLSDPSLNPSMPAQSDIWVWRFMVDARYQRQGIGRLAMQLVIEHVRRQGLFPQLKISYVPGEGCPEPLYRSLGFCPTGEVDDGEVIMALPLAAAA